MTEPKCYGIVWKDRTQKPAKERKFTFTIDDVPEKFQMSLNMVFVWARGQLSKKYKIPPAKVDIKGCRNIEPGMRNQFLWGK